MNLYSQTAAGMKWTGLSSVATAATQLLYLTVMSRLLSPRDYGLMAIALLVLEIAQTYSDMGISAALIQRQDASRDQLSSLYWLNLLSGVLMVTALWTAAPIFASVFAAPSVASLIKVISAAVLIVPLGTQFEMLFQKELRFDFLAKTDMIASVSGAIVGVTCGLWGVGVWALVWAYMTNVSTKAVILLVAGWRETPPSLQFRRADVKGYISFGLFQMGNRTLSYASQRLDQLLIGSLMGAGALGFYTFAFNLTAQPLWRINPIIVRVTFPVFAKIQHDTPRLRRAYNRLLEVVTTINAPLLLGFAAVAPVAVPLLFGEKWNNAVILVQLLSIVALCRTIVNPVASVQLAVGRADLGFWWTVLLFILSAPSIYMGAAVRQTVGVCVALLVVQLATALPFYFRMVKPVIGKCGKDYLMAILKPVTAAIIMAAAVYMMRYRISGYSPTLQVIFQVAVGAGVYGAIMSSVSKTIVADLRLVLQLPSRRVVC